MWFRNELSSLAEVSLYACSYLVVFVLQKKLMFKTAAQVTTSSFHATYFTWEYTGTEWCDSSEGKSKKM